MKCRRCDATLVYHFDQKKLICHYCDLQEEPPDICPKCRSGYVRYFGIGTDPETTYSYGTIKTEGPVFIKDDLILKDRAETADYWYDNTKKTTYTDWDKYYYDKDEYVLYRREEWRYKRWKKETWYHKHGVKAFYPIDVEFTGQDAGTLAGIDALGVAATNDVDALLADYFAKFYGPAAAAMLVHPLIADVAYAALKPAEWFARAALAAELAELRAVTEAQRQALADRDAAAASRVDVIGAQLGSSLAAPSLPMATRISLPEVRYLRSS